MENGHRTILVIEDEEHIRKFIRLTLEGLDYKVVESATGREGLYLASTHEPDVTLLDLGLPDMDGLELIRRYRTWSTAPIIVLSARGKDEDKIRALDSGSDDYLTKPFSVGELHSRIKVALRHRRPSNAVEPEKVFTTGELKVDREMRRVFAKGQEVHLTPIEYNLLEILVHHAGKVVTWKTLLGDIWGPAGGDSTHYLRIYIHQLRLKLEENPARPRYLITEAGVGYRLKTY